MSFYNQVNGLNEDKFNELVCKRIKKLEKKSLKYNPDFNVIGYHIQENIEKHELYDTEDGPSFDLTVRCFYNTFLRKGSKIVYGIVYDMQGNVSNTGSYYYLDDDSYIYEFCKSIQDKEIENEYQLLQSILEFCKDYYGRIYRYERDDMFKLIHKNEKEYFKPTIEHSITNFKGKGNAMCTEYSVMAQNLMRFFDIESYLVIGTERIGDTHPEGHAFNLARIRDSGDEDCLLIDFTNPVNIYDLNFQKVGEYPFIGDLDAIDDDLVQDLVYGEKHLVYDDYAYYEIGDSQVQITYDRERDYYIDTRLQPDNDYENQSSQRR